MAQKTAVWILGNQLHSEHPALRRAEEAAGRDAVTVILIESKAKLRSRPYQRKKLVLLLSAMRHFAADLRRRGYHVDLLQADSFTQGLQQSTARHHAERLLCMAAADFNGRRFQQEALPHRLDIPVEVLPNEQFLIAQYDPYPQAEAQKSYVMEYFYRKMRRHFGVLMAGDEPAGGAWNYDSENRQPLPKDIRPPALRRFQPDDITREVMEMVAGMEGAAGSVEGFALAVDRQGALAAFDDFLATRLADFGPYEDAMSAEHTTLFHSVLSPYLNLGLLEPLELVRRVERAYADGEAPINSVEGFIRQVLGWREFMYWQYWRLMPDLYEKNFWGSERAMPTFFWDGQTQMNCLHTVIRRAIETGYNHHIERLMVLANFALLAGLRPQAVNDWFLALYIDAYDWVMVPNVIGMGLHADGGLIATKPYIASANYINKMSNYCSACAYDRRLRTGPDACPFNTLYWDFLIANEKTLRSSPRMGPNVLGLRHLDEEERRQVRDHAQHLATSILSRE